MIFFLILYIFIKKFLKTKSFFYFKFENQITIKFVIKKI